MGHGVLPILCVHPKKLMGEGGWNFIKLVDRIVKGSINRKGTYWQSDK